MFSHVKSEWPHLDRITDPTMLRDELELVRKEYNNVRLHPGVGYVTPDDEHEGRGPAIRKLVETGLMRLAKNGQLSSQATPTAGVPE